MSIGDNIKKLRLEKKMTQKELSKLSGISEVMISQYERGIRVPKNNNLARIAYVLDKSGSKILGEELPFDLLDSEWDKNFIDRYHPVVGQIKDTQLNYSENELITNYRLLNDDGQAEASKRVEELTEISRYTQKEE